MTHSGRRRYSLLLILLLALVLRLVNLNGRPLWYDEAFSLLYAGERPATMLAGTLGSGAEAADIHPLLYYTMLHFWMQALGQTPAAARFLSVLFSTATVGVVYLLGRRLYGGRVAVAAAVIAAVAPFAVYYGQEARMYGLLGLAAASTVYFFVRGWQEGEWGAWAAFGISGAILVYAHNLGLTFLLALDLWVLWRWWRGRRPERVREVALAHLLLLLLYLPWLLVLPRQWGRVGSAYWVTRPDVATLLQTLVIFHFGYDNQALPGWLLPAALLLALLIPVLLALELRRGGAQREVDGARFAGATGLLLFLAVLPVVITFVVSLWRPVFIVRAMLPAALCYYVLVGRMLAGGRTPRPVRRIVAVAALLVVVASLVNHYTYRGFPRGPFVEAAGLLAESEGRVVHSSKLTFLPLHFHGREWGLEQRFIADRPGSPEDTLGEATQEALGLFETADLEAATAGVDHVWLVVFETAVVEYGAAGVEHPHVAWMGERFELVGERKLQDLLLLEYRR